ncbi:MAG: primosomal protein N' [Anaerolineaceae bacterium]|nr:primosomal protein N' [Anaerolineaceae bacterium]
MNIPRVVGVFDYHLPESLAGVVKPGCLVIVPFGKQTVQGIVIQEVTEPQVPKTRPVQSIIDPEPVLTLTQIELAKQLALETLTPLAVCLSLMIPPGLRKQADTHYQLGEKYLSANETSLENEPFSPLQRRLLSHLNKRKNRNVGLRGRQLDTAFRHQDWKRSTRALLKHGWLISYPVLPPPTVRPKITRTVQLACPPEEVDERITTVGRGGALGRRQAILRFLLEEPWPVDVSWVYAASGGNLQDLRRLAEMGLVTLGESEMWRDPLENISEPRAPAPELTRGQETAWQAIQPAIQGRTSTKPFLLHGVTGSGKTEIYLQAVQETLHQGRQAIVLVPEISLTPQTVRRFMSRFPGQVGLMHSRLSPGERYDTWRRARDGSLPVIVGPRSALFTPLPDPGLIVIDECHDDSYYQGDIQPYYHAVQAARLLGKLAGSTLIFGSATPRVSMLYHAHQESWPILKLPERILAHRKSVEKQMKRLGLHTALQSGEGESTILPLPPVTVVDMRQELKSGNRSIFSRALQDALSDVLKAKQQAILFLNRRGKATYVFCRDCGHSMRCPRCDLPLTYHTLRSGEDALTCHTCNYRRGMPRTCPQCSSRRIRQFGTGTEKVEMEVLARFPDARTLRWDAGTTQGKNAHELILSHFINQRADILIGTQILAKGLDLPLVTLVGVILAEVGLNFPDYRAGERTFQLLTQVAGRAGRSPLGGRVVLQTFQPEHYAIQAASKHDFAAFYDTELAYRRKIGYPPFYRLLRLEYRHRVAEQAESTARSMATQVKHWIEKGAHSATEIIGPVPCFFARVKGYYRWQIILRGPNPVGILQGQPLGEWRVEVDPASLL